MITTLALACALWNYQPPVVVETVYRAASVYSDYYVGRRTSYGEIFSQDEMTVATWEWPYNTRLRLTFEGNVVYVRVTDRNARKYKGKWIDLARKPWRMLGQKPDGLHRGVKVEVIQYLEEKNG